MVRSLTFKASTSAEHSYIPPISLMLKGDEQSTIGEHYCIDSYTQYTSIKYQGTNKTSNRWVHSGDTKTLPDSGGGCGLGVGFGRGVLAVPALVSCFFHHGFWCVGTLPFPGAHHVCLGEEWRLRESVYLFMCSTRFAEMMVYCICGNLYTVWLCVICGRLFHSCVVPGRSLCWHCMVFLCVQVLIEGENLLGEGTCVLGTSVLGMQYKY